MKKHGFTLAEVLITLTIIGVVATLTLPALMTNTAEQQAKTSLKKGINTLVEAAHMSQAIDGFDYASLTEADVSSEDKQSLYALLSKRTAVDYGKSGEKKIPSYQGNAQPTSDNYAVFFRDGSALVFPKTAKSDGKAMDIMEDNMVYGIPVIYDTNGAKGPNILSNCSGKALGATKDTSDLSACAKKSNRVIKDQFGVRLRGGVAVPNGAAARWAYEN